MVSLENGDLGATNTAHRSKRRGPKAKPLAAMNGNCGDYHGEHEQLAVEKPIEQLSDEELSAKRHTMELQAATIQEVTLALAMICDTAMCCW